MGTKEFRDKEASCIKLSKQFRKKIHCYGQLRYGNKNLREKIKLLRCLTVLSTYLCPIHFTVLKYS